MSTMTIKSKCYINVTKQNKAANITDYADSDTLDASFYRIVTVRIQLDETKLKEKNYVMIHYVDES